MNYRVRFGNTTWCDDFHHCLKWATHCAKFGAPAVVWDNHKIVVRMATINMGEKAEADGNLHWKDQAPALWR